MLASFQILVLATFAASLVYWLLPAGWVEGRRAVLLVTSGVFIWIYNPATLFIAVATALLAWLLYGITRRYPQYGWLPWLIVLPLVLNAITPLDQLIPFPAGSPRSVLFTTLGTLGMSFYTFKLYVSIKQGLKLDSLPFREVLTTTLFYPAFPAGPIDGSQKFDHVALSRDPDIRRWVMGEASAKSLRGGGMEDVIFAGTAQRPARDFAEVVLHAEVTGLGGDNDSELEVVRRIERGAGSAYRVNGRDVRAKDVALVFADAATGAHSPALVSQGRIAAVIAAKPAERRQMLEEAAGIAGLHVRRKDAEQKLRATKVTEARQ